MSVSYCQIIHTSGGNLKRKLLKLCAMFWVDLIIFKGFPWKCSMTKGNRGVFMLLTFQSLIWILVHMPWWSNRIYMINNFSNFLFTSFQMTSNYLFWHWQKFTKCLSVLLNTHAHTQVMENDQIFLNYFQHKYCQNLLCNYEVQPKDFPTN